MANRAGDWTALGESADPITTEPDKVLELAKWYADMATSMRETSATLKKVGDGDESVGKGESVDKIRKTAKSVSDALDQMVGRYESAGTAFKQFAADVGDPSDTSGGTVMAISWQALQDAQDASSELAKVSASPDPVADAKAAGTEPTDQQTSDSTARASRIDSGKGAVSAAKAKLQSAKDALSAAGQRAAKTMDGGWHDGLHDSGWYKFIHMLIKILTIIGMVLAVIAIIIPGLGLSAILGAISAGLTLVVQISNAAMGEGNVLDLVMAVVGVLTLGLGTAIGKITTTAISKGISAGKNSIGRAFTADTKTINGLAKQGADRVSEGRAALGGARNIIQTADQNADRLTIAAISEVGRNRIGDISKTISARLENDLGNVLRTKDRAIGGAANATKTIGQGQREIVVAGKMAEDLRVDNIKKLDAFEAKFKDNPNWWNVREIGTTIKNDITTVKTQFGSDFGTKAGFTSWGERLGGIDGQVGRADIDKWLAANKFDGIGSAAPGWHSWVNGGSSVWGKGNFIAGQIVSPLGIGLDQSRPWSDWVNEHKHPIPAP